jgi:hypothetical protein
MRKEKKTPEIPKRYYLPEMDIFVEGGFKGGNFLNPSISSPLLDRNEYRKMPQTFFVPNFINPRMK